jgi:hypothetical protein
MPIIISSQIIYHAACTRNTSTAPGYYFSPKYSEDCELSAECQHWRFQLNNIHYIYFYPFTEQVILWLLFGRCWFGYQPSICYPPPPPQTDATNEITYFLYSSFTFRNAAWSYSYIAWHIKKVFKQTKFFFHSYYVKHYSSFSVTFTCHTMKRKQTKRCFLRSVTAENT